MHELSIANNVVETVVESLSKVSFTRVSAVNISIGKFSGIDPSSLEFCLPMIIEESPLAGAKINIELIPLVVSCLTCQSEALEAVSLQCPRCQSSSIEVISGKDIQVSSVDVECPNDDMSDLKHGVENDQNSSQK